MKQGQKFTFALNFLSSKEFKNLRVKSFNGFRVLTPKILNSKNPKMRAN